MARCWERLNLGVTVENSNSNVISDGGASSRFERVAGSI